MLRVVPHKVLCQEYTWIESFANAWIDRLFVFCESQYFSREKLDAWQQHGIQFSTEVNVIMLITVRKFDRIALDSE